MRLLTTPKRVIHARQTAPPLPAQVSRLGVKEHGAPSHPISGCVRGCVADSRRALRKILTVNMSRSLGSLGRGAKPRHHLAGKELERAFGALRPVPRRIVQHERSEPGLLLKLRDTGDDGGG